MDEQTFEIARQYTQCAFEADEAIAHLIDIVDRCDEDTVVVYFGDQDVYKRQVMVHARTSFGPAVR